MIIDYCRRKNFIKAAKYDNVWRAENNNRLFNKRKKKTVKDIKVVKYSVKRQREHQKNRRDSHNSCGSNKHENK